MVVTSRPFAHALGTRRILMRGIGLVVLFVVLPNARLYAAQSDPSLADVLKQLREWRRSFAVHPDLAYFVATHCHVRVSRHPR